VTATTALAASALLPLAALLLSFGIVGLIFAGLSLALDKVSDEAKRMDALPLREAYGQSVNAVYYALGRFVRQHRRQILALASLSFVAGGILLLVS
jgi:hypothetical protein